jgi:class 3 adenylate cyclase
VKFNFFAKAISDSTEIKANRKFSSLRGLSKSITSYSMSAGRSWPLVSFPDFETQTSEVSNLSEAELIAFAPIVSKNEKSNWEAFAVENQGWIQEGLDVQGLSDVSPGEIAGELYPFSDEVDMAQDPEVLVPLWQIGKAPTNSSIVMMDLNTHPSFKRTFSDVLDIEHVLLSDVVDLDFLIEFSTDADERIDQPRSYILTPVFDTFQDDAKVAGFVIAVLPWESYFTNILPEGTDGFVVHVKDSCGSEFTYELNGPRAEYVGKGDHQDYKYEGIHQSSSFAESARYGGESSAAHCDYTLNIYPSATYRNSFSSIGPILISFVVAGIFVFTAFIFGVYDHLVEQRQSKILASARRTTDIIGSLFPKEVGKRLIEEAENKDLAKNSHTPETKAQLKSFLADGSELETGLSAFKTKPIADLFPETTIMFADIVGFTAWSSMREPSQVFTLLENIYHEFDVIAKRRRVFKVETIGDCYVAVCGLPDPRKDHHVAMARFARDCLHKFLKSVKHLETTLGPDTSDLGLRLGLNSGPVTAGVLRGERARFQLFGDTMNTTARMETTGMQNKIHISQETADLLKGSGKGHWVTARDELVSAKGKGKMQTYFLDIKSDTTKSMSSSTSASSSSQSESRGDIEENVAVAVPQTENGVASKVMVMKPISEKQGRLVNWNADTMARLLKAIVALREASGSKAAPEDNLKALEDMKLQRDTLVIEEIDEIVTLPVFDVNVANKQKDLDTIDLGEVVDKQLHDYVATISVMYQDNPFHNFEHASHVAMSTVKLLARIVAPDLSDDDVDDAGKNLHDHTYGITSDPLTQFACVFAALIHDVDHSGVPNSQLVKEGTKDAAMYKNKSVAEQHSVDLAWDLLMNKEYTDLRRCIYSNESEFNRFRQLIVNAVMATDIMDKDLKAARNKSWENAFDETHKENCEADTINRKATIVIAHLIQASDVAHTMQHWHIYRKWNGRLFAELHKAFSEGRSDKDPSEFWYKGELGFFDFYIIPLAKKLKDCGVFGVSSEEYLNYAKQNRREWESKGQQIVEEMVLSLMYKDPKESLTGKPIALPNTPVQKNNSARPA